jgi:adenylate cyclase
MNAYYEVIFEPVRRHGGIVSDVVGDAMMAIWAARHDDLAIRTAACRAALEILDAVERRNASGDGPTLPTRIGLHCGEMAMAHVGARDHFEYRAVGDIVNTASRLEGLNKELGTSLLVSAETLRGVGAAVSRPLGAFVLEGKRASIEVHELLGWEVDAAARHAKLCDGFAEGLAAFRQRDLRKAQTSFENVLSQNPGDGPSAWYLDRISRSKGS